VLYTVEQESHPAGVLLKVSFGEPSSNDKIVGELFETLKGLELAGGRVCLISGPASLPVAAVLTHHVSHLFAVLGVFDPKLQKFVISVSHDPEYRVGDTL
jgi:CRISPR-associated protein Csx3